MLVLFLPSCGIKIYTKKDNISKKFIVDTPFNEIITYSTTDVEFKTGSPSIVLSAPKGFIERISVHIEGNKLIVSQDDTRGYVKSTLTVTYPEILRFSTFGTGDISIKKIDQNSLYLNTSGTGDIECDDINVKTLMAETFGTGDIEIDVLKCGNAILNSLGTGDIEMKNIVADSVSAVTQGTGDIIISGRYGKIYKDASGTGKIKTNQKNVQNGDED